jgi:hypothetical protein
MKKNLKNFIAAMLIIMPALVSTPSFAGDSTDPQAVVKFVGYKNSQPVYSLNINNPTGEKLIIKVKDLDGEVLYQEHVSGVNISKNFRLNKDEIIGGTVSFEVSRVADPVIANIKIQGDLAKQ